MRAEIDEFGTLFVKAENKLERYAVDKWWEENMNPCTGNFKDGNNRHFYIAYTVKKPSIIKRTIFRLRLFIGR